MTERKKATECYSSSFALQLHKQASNTALGKESDQGQGWPGAVGGATGHWLPVFVPTGPYLGNPGTVFLWRVGLPSIYGERHETTNANLVPLRGTDHILLVHLLLMPRLHHRAVNNDGPKRPTFF